MFTLIGNSSDINSTLASMTFNGTQGATSASLRVQVDFTDKALTAIDKTLSIGLVNPPIITVPNASAVTITAGQSSVVSGISVTDFDDANLTVTVTPSGGTIAMTPVGSATVATGTDGRLIVSGTKADINATLAGLNFTAATGVNSRQRDPDRQRRRPGIARRDGHTADHHRLAVPGNPADHRHGHRGHADGVARLQRDRHRQPFRHGDAGPAGGTIAATAPAPRR